MPATRLMPTLALVALALGALGCQPQVGDKCKRATDCGLQVIRQCDVSNAPRDPDNEGECIVENCSYGVCPKEAECVKVYASEFLSIACDPEREDIPLGSGDMSGMPVMRDDCLPNEVCLPEGLCADELSARTTCRLECNTDKNCRDNYKCVTTGVGGLYVAPDPEDPTAQNTTKICVPR